MRQKLNIKNIPCYPPFRGLGGCIVLFLLLSFSLHAQTGEEIVDKAAEAYRSANGISASFLMHNTAPQGYAESFEGTIRMKGEKFFLETPDIKTWFDGQTMWSYLEHTEEVNVSTPTEEDLQFNSPAILLANYKKEFSATYKGEGTLNGKKIQKVELSPKAKADVTKVELQIEKETHFPVRISVYAKNGATGVITINQMQTGLNHPNTLFVFNEKEFPDAEIIDLR